MHDLLIVGGGPAGMTAAVYAVRKKLDMLMASPEIGGQAAWAPEVENYLGFSMITGGDLVAKFEEHVRDFGVEVIVSKVAGLRRDGVTFVSELPDGRNIESRTVLVATGRSARNLGVPGEERYKGRGVAYCATCDAPLFADENVAVVGGGNAGMSAVVQLSRVAKHVYLIEERPRLSCDQVMQDRIAAADNVTLLQSHRVDEIGGGAMVEWIAVSSTISGEKARIPVAGVFVEIGSTPNTGFLPSEVELTEYREVVIDCGNHTNIPGLFAAGDATTVPHKQIIIAAGEGAKGVLAAYDYLIRTFPDAGL